jgi:hypothetical protein
MGCSGAVQDHGAAVSVREPETRCGQGGFERAGVIGESPPRERHRPDLRDRDGGAFLLVPLPGRQVGGRPDDAVKPRSGHGLGNVVAPLVREGLSDGAVVFPRDERQAALVLGEP